MNVYYQGKALKNLDAKMAFIKGRGAQILSEKIAEAVAEGNAYDRTNGRDKDGRPIAPLRSPRKGALKGATGPPLAPQGAASRVVRNFRSEARRRGGQWRITAGWQGVTSRAGVPFLPFHDMGAGRLPRRPIFGVSPRTRARINALIVEFKSKQLKAVRA